MGLAYVPILIIIRFFKVKCKKDKALPEDSPSVKITTSANLDKPIKAINIR